MNDILQEMAMDSDNGSKQSVDHHNNSGKIEKLTDSIEGLSQRIDHFMDFANNAIPVKVVYIIFALVFGLLFGIEGIQFLFTKVLPHIYGL